VVRPQVTDGQNVTSWAGQPGCIAVVTYGRFCGATFPLSRFENLRPTANAGSNAASRQRRAHRLRGRRCPLGLHFEGAVPHLGDCLDGSDGRRGCRGHVWVLCCCSYEHSCHPRHGSSGTRDSTRIHAVHGSKIGPTLGRRQQVDNEAKVRAREICSGINLPSSQVPVARELRHRLGKLPGEGGHTLGVEAEATATRVCGRMSIAASQGLSAASQAGP